MREAASAMRRTGRSVRPVSHHPATAAHSTSSGMPTPNQRSIRACSAITLASLASTSMSHLGARSGSSAKRTVRTGPDSGRRARRTGAPTILKSAPSGWRMRMARSSNTSSPAMCVRVASTVTYSSTSARKNCCTSPADASTDLSNSSSSVACNAKRSTPAAASSTTSNVAAYNAVKRRRMRGRC